MDNDSPLTVTSHGPAGIVITEPPAGWRSIGDVAVYIEILTLAAPHIEFTDQPSCRVQAWPPER